MNHVRIESQPFRAGVYCTNDPMYGPIRTLGGKEAEPQQLKQSLAVTEAGMVVFVSAWMLQCGHSNWVGDGGGVVSRAEHCTRQMKIHSFVKKKAQEAISLFGN